MDAQIWIAIAVIVFTIISSIIKGLRKSKEQVVQPIQDTTEPDYPVEENYAVPEEGISSFASTPTKSTVTIPQDDNDILQEEGNNETLEIDLTDADEARRAFISSEILNKKY